MNEQARSFHPDDNRKRPISIALSMRIVAPSQLKEKNQVARAPVTEAAILYIKGLIDAVVFSDLIIEHSAEGFEARESTGRLKKHS